MHGGGLLTAPLHYGKAPATSLGHGPRAKHPSEPKGDTRHGQAGMGYEAFVSEMRNPLL